jgi:hypothetical protein
MIKTSVTPDGAGPVIFSPGERPPKAATFGARFAGHATGPRLMITGLSCIAAAAKASLLETPANVPLRKTVSAEACGIVDSCAA